MPIHPPHALEKPAAIRDYYTTFTSYLCKKRRIIFLKKYKHESHKSLSLSVAVFYNFSTIPQKCKSTDICDPSVLLKYIRYKFSVKESSRKNHSMVGELELEFVSPNDCVVNRDQIFPLIGKKFAQHTGSMR